MLEGMSYVPTLAIRASEMNGLEFLPGASKDRMVPCILLAPWANSLTLSKAVERAGKAFHGRHFLLDIDRDYEFSNLDSAPQAELRDLLISTGGFSNWLRFVEQFPLVWPVLQTRGLAKLEILSQIQRIQEIGRQFAVRIVLDRVPSNLNDIVDALVDSGTADFCVILEGGWTNDPLGLAVWFDGMISGRLSSIDANVPIVISCTSIPKMFSVFDKGVNRVPFSNRVLLQSIQARWSNRRRIIYGDWGSTRPREASGFAMKPYDRIDYPSNDAWYLSRNKTDGWDFQMSARALLSIADWDGSLGIWGEEMIKNTAISPAIGIDTPQKNVASRVNIHLHRQAFYGTAVLSGINLDEDWED